MYILILIFFGLLAAYFFFRRKTSLNSNTLEKTVDNNGLLLQEHVAYFQNLNDKDKKRFMILFQEFLKDVNIEGVGTEITELDKVLIGSSAIIPIFGFPDWKYQNLTNIILYPDTFDNEFQFEGENRNIMGMVGAGFMNGQMLLSRNALMKGFSSSAGKENAGIHEFVHLLDRTGGETDGVPENLMTHSYSLPWLKMIHQEMHRIQSGKSDINPYGLTNEAEFFAVSAEYFFEKPKELQHKHPELYAQLCVVFSQHPAGN